ncbi:CheR family methyltransferase [Halodesulfovibrio aestuarii]|uniref:protein-glutamate O-methyltransferase n=1 Tax=Halodesulfovibrio aestuarii TaxID=126333 RepID=A0A8G2F6H9_9BACT|nr:protein-glutamate O-methyltransferase CheR [Halodesulfovibrio aestuarii]SHI51339.1 MCP methyltransferase, CheR-type [Halodesulfovibrio aestuarii]
MSSLFSRTTSFQRELHASDEEFRQIRDHIYELCGIHIADNRKYLVENRLAARLKALNLKSFGEYYYYLRYDKNRRDELNRLYEVITTNETSFYRNPPQLKVFQEVVLKDMLDALRAKRSRRLRIWSAGCSSGEEPYTLGIILHEVLKTEIASWDIKITASDISTAVLDTARSGIYSDYALRTTPPEIIRKYFKKEGREYHLTENVKKLVRFDQLNLNDRLQIKRIERSQIIFCRNVIIYFDDEMKTRVISSFYDNLQPGGALLIGHSESLHNISRAFRPEHHKGAIVYRKDS